ncbi:MAG: multidrug efflux RND transporter permease subunit [Betaproteobacteria bacterium]|nr:multidrug efflux RND transporter permease subunit [Betaproteobacteria bacterium]
MNIAEPFVRRPVATTLLTLALVLAGALAFKLLPVSPLPQVDYPTISVSASLPGASPETMAATVATPLERALGSIAGLNEITSSSTLGNTRVTLQFDLSRDIDSAAREVQAAINAARSELPSSLPRNPTYRKINPADAPIMIIALTSDTFDRGQMYDIASTLLGEKLSQVKGVGSVTVSGSSLPAVRVDVNPAALHNYAIGMDEVRAVINANNANRPKGVVEEGARQWQIYANDQSLSAAEYAPLVVAWRNGAPIRLEDIAQVIDAVQDVRNAGISNGKPAVLIQLFRQPGANIIEVANRVRDILPQLQAAVPQAIDVNVVMERTATIKASIHETERTLLIAMGLVIMVVFIFLRSWRATLIPSVVAPVSLIGTFSVMYLLGYSINNLSLMALIIATGFVVDDAIVVLENVSRHLERGEKGMTPYQAALIGVKEVGFTVVSISISLIAVFIPVLLMEGIVGRLFREFAVTLSVAILISMVVSLTMTPMMCARLLKTRDSEKHGRLYNASEAVFNWIRRGYERTLGFALRHPFLVILALFATIGLNIHLYNIVPKGFFPRQDTGRIVGSLQADQASSFQSVRVKLDQFITIVQNDPAVESVTGFTGGGRRNGGFMFISLKPLKERGVSADQVIARLRPQLARVAGATLFLNPVQDIRMGARESNTAYQFTLRSENLEELRRWTPRLERALREMPEVTDVNSDQQERGLQTTVIVDRASAARLGITFRAIDTALNLAFSQAQVSTIYTSANQYRVVLGVAPPYWQGPEALDQVYLLSPTRGQVPLSSIARFEFTNTALAVNHQGQFAASTVSFNLPLGYSLSDAVRANNEAMARIGVPTSVYGSFQGTARGFQSSLNAQPFLILAALIAVYIVLGILYESFIHPITIISTLPSAGVGALLALMLFETEFGIIAMIGVILLIGIVKKNAIMMIDFAIEAERRDKLTPRDAIYQAAVLRFRPIMMTTMAALFAAIPLALGTGDGAEMRQPLGIAIVGGLVMSQILTLYTTPVVYLYLDRFRLWCGRLRRKPARVLETAGEHR